MSDVFVLILRVTEDDDSSGPTGARTTESVNGHKHNKRDDTTKNPDSVSDKRGGGVEKHQTGLEGSSRRHRGLKIGPWTTTLGEDVEEEGGGGGGEEASRAGDGAPEEGGAPDTE